MNTLKAPVRSRRWPFDRRADPVHAWGALSIATVGLIGVPTVLATIHATERGFRWWWPTNWMTVPLSVFAIGVVLLLVPVRRSQPRRSSPELERARPASAPAGTTPPSAVVILRRVQENLRSGRADEADQELAAAGGVLPEYQRMYWKARVALMRDNIRAAGEYVNRALERNPRDEAAVALKIRVLLLSDRPGDRASARDFAAQSLGISPSLDSWISCLRVHGIFSSGILTATELDSRCPHP